MASAWVWEKRREEKKGSSATSRTPMFYSYFLFSNTEKLIQRRRFSKQEPYTHMARCLPHTEWEYTHLAHVPTDLCACLSFTRSLILFYFHLFLFGAACFCSFFYCFFFYSGNLVDTFCLFVSCVIFLSFGAPKNYKKFIWLSGTQTQHRWSVCALLHCSYFFLIHTRIHAMAGWVELV